MPTPIIVFVKGGQRRRLNQRNQTVHRIGSSPSFSEQACLVEFSRRCVFFTEGVVGSHIYVPPFMGKDVVAIGSRTVHEEWAASTDFWNRSVFRFGGRIIPKVSEDVLASGHRTRELADEIVSAFAPEPEAGVFSARPRNA